MENPMKFHCLIFGLLFEFLFFSCSVDGAAVYVCPVDLSISSKLIDYRKNILCKDYKTVCSLKNDFTSKIIYQDTVVIIHDGEWSIMNDIATKLSSCGIPYITMDVTRDNFDLSSFCSSWRTTLMFSVINGTQQFLDRWKNNAKQCAIRNAGVMDPFFSQLIDTCPISIIITGETNCDLDMISYSLKLYGNIVTSTTDNSTGQISKILNRELKVGTLQYVPFANYTGTNDTIPYEGVVKEMMDKIADATGISYVLIRSPGDKAGIFSNGSWDGLIGMLVRNEIDMIAAPLTVTYDRSIFVSFSPPYYFESLGIMLRVPKLVPRLWRAFTLFTVSLWAVIFVAAIVTVILLYVLHVYAALPTDTGFERMTDCIWYVVACMSNQAHEINPGSWSAQNYLAFWWLYVVAIIAIYGGVLISLLTNKTVSLPFNTLSELADSLPNGEYKVCIQGSTGFHARIWTSDAPVHVALKSWLVKNPQFITSMEGCVNYLLNMEKVVFLAEVTRLQGLQASYCDLKQPLVILDDRFYPGWFSFAYQKNSPLLPMQTQTISEIAESGLVDGWKLKYSNKTKPCRVVTPQTINDDGSASSQGLNMDPLTLSEVGGPFVLLTAGLIISLVSFVLERFRVCKKGEVDEDIFAKPKHKADLSSSGKPVEIKVRPVRRDVEKTDQEVQYTQPGVYFTY